MSELLEVAMELAHSLNRVGAMDDITLREIEALAIKPNPEFTPADIKRIRSQSHVSQAVFAKVLGIKTATIQKWEQGLKTPSGAARRLLDVVDRKGLQTLL